MNVRSSLSLWSYGRPRNHLSVDLADILENHTFVGIVDLKRCLALVQHTTKLYMVDYGTLSYVVAFISFPL